MNTLTAEGYDNILDIAVGRCNLRIDHQFIDKHLETLKSAWPHEDDEECRKNYPGENAWWTFISECNSGGIDDTCQRDILMSELTKILFGLEWPINGDTHEVQQTFENALTKHRNGE